MTEDEQNEQQREFERYCRETQFPKVIYAIFGVLVAILAGLMYRGL